MSNRLVIVLLMFFLLSFILFKPVSASSFHLFKLLRNKITGFLSLITGRTVSSTSVCDYTWQTCHHSYCGDNAGCDCMPAGCCQVGDPCDCNAECPSGTSCIDGICQASTATERTNILNITILDTNDVYTRYLGVSFSGSLPDNWWVNGGADYNRIISSSTRYIVIPIPINATPSVGISTTTGYWWKIRMVYKGISKDCIISSRSDRCTISVPNVPPISIPPPVVLSIDASSFCNNTYITVIVRNTGTVRSGSVMVTITSPNGNNVSRNISGIGPFTEKFVTIQRPSGTEGVYSIRAITSGSTTSGYIYCSASALSLSPPCDSYGDVNGDGRVTVADAMFISQYIAGNRNLTDEQKARGDVNGDSQITVADEMLISQYINGNRDTFPVCMLRQPPCDSYGDINGDGKVSTSDATIVGQYLAGNINLNDEQKRRADVNGDGRVTVADAMFISQYANNTRDTFPVCIQPANITEVRIIGCPSNILNYTGITGLHSENKDYYVFTLNGRTDMTIRLSMDSSVDYDLYVKWDGSTPNLDDWDCRPYFGQGSPEECTHILNPGTYAILVHKYAGVGGYRLSLTCSGAETSTTTPATQPPGIFSCDVANFNFSVLRGVSFNTLWCNDITSDLSHVDGSIQGITPQNITSRENEYLIIKFKFNQGRKNIYVVGAVTGIYENQRAELMIATDEDEDGTFETLGEVNAVFVPVYLFTTFHNVDTNKESILFIRGGSADIDYIGTVPPSP